MIGCSAPSCNRAAVRTRDGQRWCMYHPDSVAPPIDLISGKLRDPKDPTKPKAAIVAKRRPRRGDTAAHVDFADLIDTVLPPAAGERLDVTVLAAELERTNPVAAPDPVDSASDPGLIPRPTRRPSTAFRPLPSRPAPDGPCPTPGCSRPHRHGGRCPIVVDEQEFAQRYLAGERLFDLAAAFHIGVARARTILRTQGVTIRPRGARIDDTSGRHAAPLDVEECRRLYATGLDTREVAFRLGVRTSRVADQLTADGLLRPAASCHVGPVVDVRVKLTEAESGACRARADQLGIPLAQYLRRLIEADLRTADLPADLETGEVA